jgi:hypothetical protein
MHLAGRTSDLSEFLEMFKEVPLSNRRNAPLNRILDITAGFEVRSESERSQIVGR